MVNEPNINATRLPTRHALDAYRVAYWYAWQAHQGRPDRRERAEYAAREAVDCLERSDRETTVAWLVH